MFCIECGQRMAEGAKFCAYCGTRRVVLSQPETVSAPPAPQPVAPPVVTPPPPVRSVRSTAEIMPARIRPVVPPTPPSPTVEPAASPQVAETADPAQETFPYEAEQNGGTIPIEPAVIDDETTWQTPAPVPTDAYPQPEQYSDRQPTPPIERARPSAAAAPRKSESVPYTAVPFAAPDYGHDLAPVKRKISPVLIGAVIVALIALGGIVWMLRSSMSAAGKAATKVEITMFPLTAKTVAGKGIDFAATVTGAPTSEVTWSVEEGSDTGQIQTRGASAKEGAISLYATYIPKAPGTFHLVATSSADPTKSASAEVTVAPNQPEAKRKH